MAATSIHGALAHRLGAGRAWVVDVRDDSVAGVCPCVEAAAADVRAADQLVDVDLPDGPARLCATLAGLPVAASHVRRLADDARAAGAVLVVDNTAATSAHAGPCRAHAHVAYERLAWMGEGAEHLACVALSRDAVRDLPRLVDALSRAAAPDDALAEALVARLDALDENARVASANARTVAAYLVAHPLVHRVAYPGLVGGEGYEAAHTIMHDGFGPRVDWQDLDGAWHTVRLSAGDDARDVCASLPVRT